jgi:hypothetical protein
MKTRIGVKGLGPGGKYGDVIMGSLELRFRSLSARRMSYRISLAKFLHTLYGEASAKL